MFAVIVRLILAALALIAILSLTVIPRWRDKWISGSFLKQLLWLLLIISSVVFLLTVVCESLPIALYEKYSYWYSFMDPGNINLEKDGDPETLIPRIILVSLIGLLGTFLLSGLLISTLSNTFERRIDKIKNGTVYYRFQNHVVIIGFDSMTIGLIKQMSSKPEYEKSKFLIQTTQDVASVRHILMAQLDKDIDKKVTIVLGGRNSLEDLSKLYLDKASEIFVLGESGEYDHDSLNLECVSYIADILNTNNPKLSQYYNEIRRRKNQNNQEKKDNKPVTTFPHIELPEKINCNVLFEYQSTFVIFQQQDIDDRIKESICFKPFNFYESWAEKVFVKGVYNTHGVQENILYRPLDFVNITSDSDNFVHLVVVGMTRMGVAMGLEAMLLAHFPNFVTKNIKTRITFIDSNVVAEMNFLRSRYKHLFNAVDYTYYDVEDPSNKGSNKNESPKFTDIELEFINGRIESEHIQNLLTDWSKDENRLLTIAVCFNYPPSSIAAGLYLSDEVLRSNAQILVRQETSYQIISRLKTCDKFKNVRPFGMLDECFDFEMVNSEIPMSINYFYSYFYDNKKDADSVDKIEAKKKWDSLKVSKKWSNVYFSNSIPTKIRSCKCLGCRNTECDISDKIEIMSEVEHNRWNIDQLLLGYRPTTEEEYDIICEKPEEKSNFKNNYFAHNDIRKFSELLSDGNIKDTVCEYDRSIIRSIGILMKDNK